MTTPLARVIPTASLLLMQSACMAFGFGKPKPTDTGSHAGSRAPGHANGALPSPGLASKPVVGKQPPARLLARDGTSCIVLPDKYEKTILGTSIWCVWTDTNR